MGWFSDFLKGLSGNNTIVVQSILPDVAKSEIKAGRLPVLKTDSIFISKGEKIHFIDKAVMIKEKKIRQYKTYSHGASGPSIFGGGVRTRLGAAYTKPIDQLEIEQYKGILYITNKRVIFVSKKQGFDKQHKYLSAATPYSNGVELQYGSTIYCLVIPDGKTIFKLLQLVH